MVQDLITRYGCKVPGEVWSKESEREAKRVQRLACYLSYSDYVAGELRLNGGERERLRWIVRTIPLRCLYNNAPYSMVITCLGFMVKREGNSSVKLGDYSVCGELDSVFVSVVAMNAFSWLCRNRPLPFNRN